MNKKLQTIQVLKSKLFEIQNHLDNIVGEDKKGEASPVMAGTPKANFNNTEKPYFRNPTFWGTSPILGKENEETFSPKVRPKKSRSKEKAAVPLNIRKIIDNLEAEYYQSAPQSCKNYAETSH